MELNNVVPWGRSLAEYQAMFALSEEDLNKSILGCGDGPASFNAELSEKGGSVVSVDPVYAFSRAQIEGRIAKVYPTIMEQLSRHREDYVWDAIPTVEDVGRLRMRAMDKFLADYEPGKEQGRYVKAALPDLPFQNQSFDLALCSHFLFLYSSQLSREAHLAGVRELCRVAREVRIYPLISLEGVPSPHLPAVMEALSAEEFEMRLVPVAYRFQKGAVEMLVLRRA